MIAKEETWMTKGTMEEIQNSYINIQELSLSIKCLWLLPIQIALQLWPFTLQNIQKRHINKIIQVNSLSESKKERKRRRRGEGEAVLHLQRSFAHKHINQSGKEIKWNEKVTKWKRRHKEQKHLLPHTIEISIITCSLAACTVLGRTGNQSVEPYAHYLTNNY